MSPKSWPSSTTIFYNDPVQTTCFITKFLPFLLDGQRMKNCIFYLENAAFQTSRNNHTTIINECIGICRRNSLVFFAGSVVAASVWATKPLLWKRRDFPVNVWLPFDAKANIFIFSFTYLIIALGPFIAGLLTGVVDPLIAGLIYHATSQIKILKDNLQNLSDCAKHKVNSAKDATKEEVMIEALKKCITHHDEILRFLKEFEDCFSLVLFSQIAGAIFVICFCCVQIGKLNSIDSYFGQFAMYLMVVLAQVYFYCYYGSTLSEESDSLRDAIYMGPWYTYDIRTQRTLLTVMERAKIPVIVTAEKLVDLSLVTFTTILQRSYSLIAVMQNYQ
ncbi:putative odorant receptor 92a [Zophobas morio]|uniref:putative odorant receptor 92a n=1 Tax=Zophobas morio TaxID=2755281 RepID=UPI003082F397